VSMSGNCTGPGGSIPITGKGSFTATRSTAAPVAAPVGRVGTSTLSRIVINRVSGYLR
jgi:hypothetical protein